MKASAAQCARASFRDAGSPIGPMAREERIIYVTPGYRLVALNAKTGAPVTSFGKNGIVDLKMDDDQEIDPITGEVGLHAAPVVAKDVVIVGAAHRSGGVPRARKTTSKASCAASTCAPASACGSSTPSPSRASSATTPGKGFGRLHRQHRRVGADQRRRGARHGVSARRTAHRRLLRRPPARQRPVRREHRRR